MQGLYKYVKPDGQSVYAKMEGARRKEGDIVKTYGEAKPLGRRMTVSILAITIG